MIRYSEERKQEYEITKEQFNEWAIHNPHNILTSFPKSGRNYLRALLANVSGCNFSNGLPRSDEPYEFSDMSAFVLHRGIWEIRGDKGKYVLLFRDPRDAILSRTYTEAIRRDVTPEEVMADEDWVVHNIGEWKTYFDIFLKYEAHLVQYERLCLFPVETIRGILSFLELSVVREIGSVVSALDSVKPDPRVEHHVAAKFDTGAERYRAHCLKWQRDSLIKQSFLESVWQELADTMSAYDYTKLGHSNRIFDEAHGI